MVLIDLHQVHLAAAGVVLGTVVRRYGEPASLPTAASLFQRQPGDQSRSARRFEAFAAR